LGGADLGGGVAAGGLGLTVPPESYWSMLAEGGGTATDAAAAGAGTVDLGAGATGLNEFGALNGQALASEAGFVPGSFELGTTASGGTAASGLGGGFSLTDAITNPVGKVGSALQRVINGQGTKEDMATLSTAATVAGGAAALGGAVSGGLGGGTTQTSTTNVPGMSAEEKELIGIYTELAKRQLASVDQLQPFQKRLLELSLAELEAQTASDKAVNGAVSPEERAALARDEFDRSKRLGPIQDEILGIQLDTLRRGGAATPEQKAQIAASTDSAIQAGYGDIDMATERGIGLISDELANSRGLRMTDTPILREATLLTRAAGDQKASLSKNLRAGQANAELNYPLGVAQLTSQIGGQQQAIAENAKQFQETLRQRAFENRMKITGQATSTGLGLASTGGGQGSLSALTQSRLAGGTTTTNVDRGIGLAEIGSFASGIGGLMTGLGRL
jgi:hypothetical protein